MSVLKRPLTPPARRVNPIIRYCVGPALYAEAERLSYLYMTREGYCEALSAYVHTNRDFASPFLWEVRDFIDRLPGDTVSEMLEHVREGLK